MNNIRPGILSPFNSVAEYQRFASTLAYAENSVPAATTSDCGRFVSYKDKTLEVGRWIRGPRALFEDANTAMQELCTNVDIPVAVPAIVADDMVERCRGYSWLDNGTFVKDRALMQVLMNHPTADICTKGRSGLIFNTGSMLRFMEKAAKVNKALSVLCHCLPGQPSRGTEFVEHKIRNSMRPRTFFRIHGAEWLVTRRVKCESIIRHEVFLPSKIPPELQKLLEQYLLVV
jgi:hypothetical protein